MRDLQYFWPARQIRLSRSPVDGRVHRSEGKVEGQSPVREHCEVAELMARRRRALRVVFAEHDVDGDEDVE
jgi:hypothetical protein